MTMIRTLTCFGTYPDSYSSSSCSVFHLTHKSYFSLLNVPGALLLQALCTCDSFTINALLPCETGISGHQQNWVLKPTSTTVFLATYLFLLENLPISNYFLCLCICLLPLHWNVRSIMEGIMSMIFINVCPVPSKGFGEYINLH